MQAFLATVCESHRHRVHMQQKTNSECVCTEDAAHSLEMQINRSQRLMASAASFQSAFSQGFSDYKPNLKSQLRELPLTHADLTNVSSFLLLLLWIVFLNVRISQT